jgi:hypothetical protein
MTNKTLHILIAKERREQLLHIEKLLNPLTTTAERPGSSAAPVRNRLFEPVWSSCLTRPTGGLPNEP